MNKIMQGFKALWSANTWSTLDTGKARIFLLTADAGNASLIADAGINRTRIQMVMTEIPR